MARGGRRPRQRALVLAPDDPVAVAARAVVRFHLRAFATAEGRARGGDVEGVHDVRVATRRLRATLRLFAPVVPASMAQSARREIAWLGAAIGAVRDLDVLGEVVASRAARLDAVLRQELGPLAVAIHDRRAAAHAGLVEALDSARARRLLDRLSSFADSPVPARGRDTLGARAPDLVRPLVRGVLRAGRGVTAASPPAALHRLRVRAKRLRYALETLHALGGRSIARAIGALARLQDRLGRHQDAVTAVAWLRAYVETPGVRPPTILAAGALVHALDRRARRIRRRFPALWAHVDRRRVRRALVGEVGRRMRRAPLEAAS